MKPQDTLFILILVVLVIKRNPRLFVGAGLVSLLISMPLFAKWIFFTAQRFTWYAVVFLLIAVLLNLKETRDNR